jgi:hypothetical protein
MNFRARIEVLAESGRSHPIKSGYICDFRVPTEDGDHVFGMGRVDFDLGQEGPLGQTVLGVVQPGVPATWKNVKVGDQLRMQEGHVVVALATILDVQDFPAM